MWLFSKKSENIWEYMYLKPILAEALKYLKLPSLSLDICIDLDNCLFYPDRRAIVIGLMFFISEHFNYYLKPYIPSFIKSYEDKLRFAIYHEIGHHFQMCKHKKWYDHFSKSYNHLKVSGKTLEPNLYRKLKKEANADKIALILFKKFRKEDIFPKLT